MPWVKEEIANLTADIRRHKDVPGYEIVTRDMRIELAKMRRMTWRQQNYEYAVQQLREEEPDLSLSRAERYKLRCQKERELQEKWQPEEDEDIADIRDIDRYFDALDAEEKLHRIKFLPVAKGPPIDPIGPWPKPKKPRKRRPHKPLFPTGTYDQKRHKLRLLIAKKRPQWKGRIAVFRNHITIYHLGWVYAPFTPDMTRLQLTTTLNRLDNLEREGVTPYGGSAIRQPPASDSSVSG
jgi:hypothetical protein